MNFLRQKDEMEGTCAHPSIFLTIFLKKEVEMLYHLFYQTNTDNKIYYNRRKSRFYR